MFEVKKPDVTIIEKYDYMEYDTYKNVLKTLLESDRYIGHGLKVTIEAWKYGMWDEEEEKEDDEKL